MASDPYSLPPIDPINPYAAPRSEVGPERLSYDPTLAARPEFGDIFARSWEIYKAQLGMCVGAFVILIAINMGIGFGSQIIQTAVLQALGQGAAFLAALLGLQIASMLLQMWLNAGLLLFMVNVARGREPAIGQVFGGGPFLLRYCVAAILVGGGVFSIVAILAVPVAATYGLAGTDSPALPIVAVLCGILALAALIWYSIKMSLYAYLIVDRDAGMIDSIRLSFELTKGNELLIFLVGLVSIPIGMVGFLACIVGIVFTIPFTMLLFAMTYVAIVGRTGLVKPDIEFLPELEPI